MSSVDESAGEVAAPHSEEEDEHEETITARVASKHSINYSARLPAEFRAKLL